jgi:DNA polymerase III delta prime subunit
MNNTETQIIKNNITGQLNNKLVAPLIISGVPGTGKSATIKQLAKDLSMNLVEYSMPSCTIEKLSGLPTEFITAELNNATVFATDRDVYSTVWSIPEMVADCCREALTGPTILLLDDFHAMGQHLQSYFYELLLERKMGNYKLPSNVAIIGTMNNSEMAGMTGISSPIRNRLAILNVEFNFDSWFNDHGGNRLHYLVASFLRAKSHFCIEEETTTIEGFASARVWTAIANELTFHDNAFIQANAKRIAGMQVSNNAAQAFQTHVNYVAAIDFNNTVKSRKLVDLSKQDPLDSIIYAYITNFIQTVDDGLYLFELLSANKTQSVFIGFIFGELYTKYCSTTADSPLSDGITFVIDKLLGKALSPSSYPNTSKEKLAKADAVTISDRQHFMTIAQEYLL